MQTNAAEIGILVCGSGVGAAVAANKLRGVRAALCGDTYSAHQSREHDDCNVLCLGARVTGAELALEIVRSFVAARFTGEERRHRHGGRVVAGRQPEEEREEGRLEPEGAQQEHRHRRHRNRHDIHRGRHDLLSAWLR